MFRLFRNLKSMAWMFVVIILLVTGQAVAELYLPEKMSEIIDDGIYIDYEPLYKYEEMQRPDSLPAVESDATLKGYDEDTIPVFEMVDGFSTYDLRQAIEEEESQNSGGVSVDFVFRDIPVKDSKELFDNVLTPFMEGLEVYQRKAFEWRDENIAQSAWEDWTPDFRGEYFSNEDREDISNIINVLLVFEYDKASLESSYNPDSIKIDEEDEQAGDSDNTITVNDLLNQDPRDEDSDAMASESNRTILTACVSRMKHSVYGNLMPIPIDENGNRIATDEFGQPLDPAKLIYVYSDSDGNEVASAEESYTGRPDPMPDYEVIICNNVLAYAYTYVGDKWVETSRGMTDDDAREMAREYNAEILADALIYNNKHYEDFTAEEIKTIEDGIDEIVLGYTEADDMVYLSNLLSYQDKRASKIIKEIGNYYQIAEDTGARSYPMKEGGTFVTEWRQFWAKIGNYLTLSATGTSRERFEEEMANDEVARYGSAVVEFKTYKDMMLPDGQTTQTDDMNFILRRGGLMLLLTLGACAAAILAAMFSSRLAANFSAIIRSKVFGKVETFSLGEFDEFSTASLITRSTNDVNQIQQVFLLILRTGLIAPITLIGGFIMSAGKSFYMTSVLFYDIPILVIASVVAAKVVYPLFQVIQKKVDRLTLITREGLTGIRVVRAFNKQESENKRFGEVNDSLTKTAIVVNRWCAVLAPLIAVVMNCSMVGVVWRASQQVAGVGDSGEINVGDMMAVIQYMTQIMMALVMLATVFVMFPRATASAKRILEVLDTTNKIKDPETPNRNYTEVGTVRFNHVYFKFAKDAEHYILNDIDFVAEKGKVTAIVGGTGSGKSAIINLIPHFYDVQQGEILFDGVNVKDYAQAELRDKLGFVPQKSVLMSGTIRSNLMYGKPDATDEDCWEALRIAQADAFVREKDGGLDAKVEQGGGNFSGGQRQRLAIARAIIRKPELLVFDDSFSALDFRTDKNLRAALKEITHESATIIVAQRIGTIMDADNILVLDGGRIVGQGRHEELIHNCQVYRDIALSQMSEEELGL